MRELCALCRKEQNLLLTTKTLKGIFVIEDWVCEVCHTYVCSSQTKLTDDEFEAYLRNDLTKP